MSAQVAADLRAGDVVRYEPKSRWCHDGYAIVKHNGNVGGDLVLVDTFWLSGGTVVTPESYEVLFNLADYDEKPASEWEKYAPADRQYIPKHSGHQTVHLVRKGAKPDFATQIENARDRILEAELEVRMAQHSLDWRRSELSALTAADDAAEAGQP